ncbi:MAG: Fic family protein [Candidatus Peregrinibacteria bacterium]|nr:Fic family protein [Candidatus Peregrinibacteria bacterium]
MATSLLTQHKIQELKKEYDRLKKGKESLIRMIDEAEMPESIYNSNAIENSTLTLQDTEKILLEMEVSKNLPLREVYEAKNLARVMEYMNKKCMTSFVTVDLMKLLHQMLIGGIDDEIAGRFRSKGEYVRVGTHVAPAPEHIESQITEALGSYNGSMILFLIDRIAKFHLDFETTHPFNDGNGRMGRVLINWQLCQTGFPLITVRNKEKKYYYQAFQIYGRTKSTSEMEKVISLALMESFHKRITYLKGQKIMTLAEYARKKKQSFSTILNAARRQTIPAFRERAVWKIGV